MERIITCDCGKAFKLTGIRQRRGLNCTHCGAPLDVNLDLSRDRKPANPLSQLSDALEETESVADAGYRRRRKRARRAPSPVRRFVAGFACVASALGCIVLSFLALAMLVPKANLAQLRSWVMIGIVLVSAMIGLGVQHLILNFDN